MEEGQTRDAGEARRHPAYGWLWFETEPGGEAGARQTRRCERCGHEETVDAVQLSGLGAHVWVFPGFVRFVRRHGRCGE